MRRVCQVPDTSRKKEKNRALCRPLDRTARAKLRRLLPVSAHRSDFKQEQVMMKKLRIFFTAALLVSALISNANAFTAGDGATFDPAKPKAGLCWYNVGGWWYVLPC
jgi:hypothetical protein